MVGADAALLRELEARAARRLDQASLAAVMVQASGHAPATLLDMLMVLRLVPPAACVDGALFLFLPAAAAVAFTSPPHEKGVAAAALTLGGANPRRDGSEIGCMRVFLCIWVGLGRNGDGGRQGGWGRCFFSPLHLVGSRSCGKLVWVARYPRRALDFACQWSESSMRPGQTMHFL
ncbi:hypothetical protein ACQ4PT_036535 [Festuca glaucescens]